jgi:hypothetical protein
MATMVRKGSDRPGAKKAIRKTARKAVAKKGATKNAAARKTAAKKPVAKKTAAAKTRSRSARGGGITPARALANTRRLLEAKHAHDREPPPWQALEERHGNDPQPGFQDAQARDQANELHAAESRMEGIHGAGSTQDRHNQGKRDKR